MVTRVFTSNAILSLLLLGFCLAGSSARAGEEVLELFVDSWDVRLKTLEPVKSEITYRETYAWVLNQRFIRGETEEKPDETKDIFYGTYNRQQDRYPFWLFNSTGFYSESQPGIWDPRTRTLTFKSPPVSDVSFELKVVFPDERTRSWTYVARDIMGNALRQEGVATRRGVKDAPKAGPPALTAPQFPTQATTTSKHGRIAELTPQMLGVLLFIVVIVAPALTMVLSALLLWCYRRSVNRQMAARGGFDKREIESGTRRQQPGDGQFGREVIGRALYQQAIRGPRREALCYAAAGFVLAIVFAIAARYVYPYRLDFPGFSIGLVIYAWPVVPALFLILPATWRSQAALVAIYFVALLLLILWAGDSTGLSAAAQVGGIKLPQHFSASPVGTLWLWLVVNGLPTMTILLCFNKWARSVAPLMLGFITTAVSGVLVAYLGLFTDYGFEAAVAIASLSKVHPGWLVAGALLLSAAVFGLIGWALARWIARANRLGNGSDQSLMLDAMWLMFASYYAMWLIFGGLVWAATAVIAFALYKVTLALGRWITVRPLKVTRDLTFLRVFSLGRRSDRLLGKVAKYWRYIGNVQVITGPDVARSTVHPHQFLDFLGGKLATHFVRDTASLERSLEEWKRIADRDGRYSINNFFCHADSWQHLLPRLLQQDDDTVLMDLRSFSADNAGCVHELNYLAGAVPLDRVVLIEDDTTDSSFLEHTLHEAWQTLPPDSPNRGRSPDEVHLHRYDSRPRAVRRLVRHLCQAGSADPTTELARRPAKS